MNKIMLQTLWYNLKQFCNKLTLWDTFWYTLLIGFGCRIYNNFDLSNVLFGAIFSIILINIVADSCD
jgi:hypothetical protein